MGLGIGIGVGLPFMKLKGGPPDIISDGNTVGWYLADDLTTITKDGADAVSAWNDYLASGHNLVQGVGALQPLWVSPNIIRFDGVNHVLKTATFTWNQPEMIYMVVKQVSWTNSRRVFDGFNNATGILRQDTASPQLEIYAGVFSGNISDLAVGSFGIVRVLFNGVNSSLQVNKAAAWTGNAGGANMSGFYLANAAPGGVNSNIEVQEIILRKTADAAATQTLIYNYLAAKYSI